MKPKNPFLFLIALAMTTQMLHAEIIASFSKDFRPGTPAEGWSYCRNAGDLTDPTSWLPLAWNQSQEMYTVNASTYPDRKGQAYLMLRNGSVRPGKGSDSGETSKTEAAAIAVYTLKEGEQGTIKLTSASVARSGTVEGTVRLSVLVNSEIKKEIVVHSSEKTTRTLFNMDLGALNVGDKIAVAIGPDGDGKGDSVGLDFAINRQ